MKGEFRSEMFLYITIFILGFLSGLFERKWIPRFITKETMARLSQTAFIRPPWFEGINGLLFVIIVYIHGLTLDSILIYLFLSILILISIIDVIMKEIPNIFPILIFVLGIVGVTYNSDQWRASLIGMLGIGLFLFFLYLITKGRGIGGGDVKFLAASGFFLGIYHIVISFILGCLLAFLGQSILWCMGRKSRTFPFGPYLCFGILIDIFYGSAILRWYLT